MGKRKSQYLPKPYESIKGYGDTSANIYESMLRSAAWKDLKSGAQTLYLHMKSQKYAQKDKPIKDDETAFRFNRCKWIKGKPYSYGLYSNEKQFYKDRDALIEHGFITVVERNKNQRTANVYRLSDGWKIWQAKPP